MKIVRRKPNHMLVETSRANCRSPSAIRDTYDGKNRKCDEKVRKYDVKLGLCRKIRYKMVELSLRFLFMVTVHAFTSGRLKSKLLF